MSDLMPPVCDIVLSESRFTFDTSEDLDMDLRLQESPVEWTPSPLTERPATKKATLWDEQSRRLNCEPLRPENLQAQAKQLYLSSLTLLLGLDAADFGVEETLLINDLAACQGIDGDIQTLAERLQTEKLGH